MTNQPKSEALLAEIERLRAERDALKAKLDEARRVIDPFARSYLSQYASIESTDLRRAFEFVAFNPAACFSSSAARNKASPAVFPASMPSFFASATLPSTVSLYASSDISDAKASRLCETIDPVVVNPIAIAATAANTSDEISQKSHHSPSWPRNKVEAAAFALAIVSCIGGALLVAFCVFALREYRRP